MTLDTSAVPDRCEEEVLVAVVAKEGIDIGPPALTGHLARRLAHFMVPRYLHTLDALPETPASKIEEHALRAQGVTGDPRDRVAAGIHDSREKPD